MPGSCAKKVILDTIDIVKYERTSLNKLIRIHDLCQIKNSNKKYMNSVKSSLEQRVQFLAAINLILSCSY